MNSTGYVEFIKDKMLSPVLAEFIKSKMESAGLDGFLETQTQYHWLGYSLTLYTLYLIWDLKRPSFRSRNYLGAEYFYREEDWELKKEAPATEEKRLALENLTRLSYGTDLAREMIIPVHGVDIPAHGLPSPVSETGPSASRTGFPVKWEYPVVENVLHVYM